MEKEKNKPIDRIITIATSLQRCFKFNCVLSTVNFFKLNSTVVLHWHVSKAEVNKVTRT